ncbi:outer membrane cobalamin receptor protein [Thermanaerovibrio velox DSM 12556]|uniref:Outer membrane cobalamin receptor protein n=1 Tax=Thermanaerovibrio velox DSM 12556 TaxID=926567 RepID=H0UNT3_9BACT|nr:TonB-dependent receptor [Thermanaerovibrio velox]EHM09419.1 outer membrane cobalamin receptor protein [Thermanaerovibrio velox DSM 12556]
MIRFRCSSHVLVRLGLGALLLALLSSPLPVRGMEVPVVEVTGSRLADQLADLPSQGYVITSADMASRGFQNLQEALDSLPGVSGLVNGAGMAQSKGISIRGMTTETLLLVDGVPFMTSSYGAGAVLGAPFDLRSIPISSVERVEVVKGASSALYGSHGAAGVINVITVKGASGPGGPFQARFTAGSGGYGMGSFSAAAASSSMWARVSYSREEEGEREIRLRGNGLRDFSKDYRSNHYGLSAGSASGRGWEFSSQWGDYSSRWTYDGADNHQDNSYSRVALTVPLGGMKLKGYYGESAKKVFDSSGRSDYRDRNMGLSLEGRGRLWGNGAAYGLEVRRDDSDYLNVDNPWGNNDPYDLKRDGIIAYGETTVPLGDLTADLGLRYERWHVEEGEDQSELAPKVSLYREDSTGRLWYLSAGRFFVMPSFFQIYMPMRSFGEPNYSLRPEKGWSYEGGVKGKDRSWSLGVFYTDVEDKIKYWSDPVTWMGKYVNLDEYRAYGVEGMFRVNLSGEMYYQQGISWTYGEELSGGTWSRSGDPRWDVTGSLNWARGSWGAGVTGRFYGDRAIANNSRGYSDEDLFLVDAFMSYTSKDVTFRLGASNLFDRRYVLDRNGYLTPERRLYISLDARF